MDNYSRFVLSWYFSVRDSRLMHLRGVLVVLQCHFFPGVCYGVMSKPLWTKKMGAKVHSQAVLRSTTRDKWHSWVVWMPLLSISRNMSLKSLTKLKTHATDKLFSWYSSDATTLHTNSQWDRFVTTKERCTRNWWQVCVEFFKFCALVRQAHSTIQIRIFSSICTKKSQSSAPTSSQRRTWSRYRCEDAHFERVAADVTTFTLCFENKFLEKSLKNVQSSYFFWKTPYV